MYMGTAGVSVLYLFYSGIPQIERFCIWTDGIPDIRRISRGVQKYGHRFGQPPTDIRQMCLQFCSQNHKVHRICQVFTWVSEAVYDRPDNIIKR